MKPTLKTTLFAVAILLLAAGSSFAQSVTLTASRQTTTLPDGTIVPMWGWVCSSPTGVTCTAAGGGAQAGGTTWQPPVITVPTGAAFSITLANMLPTNTSLVVVGQLAGGLGTPVKTASPVHTPQTSTTWPANAGGTFTPPTQADRARSFVQEAAPLTGTQTYSWAAGALSPGTYLISTGTRPSIQGPMGLYGVLVVTTAPVAGVAPAAGTPGTAYKGVAYDAEAVMLFSEIDPVQNKAVDAVAAAAGTGVISEATELLKWNDKTCAAATPCYPPAVNYTPLYFLINGKSLDNTNPAASAVQLPTPAVSNNVLVRLVNASPRMHVPSIVGLPMSLIAEDGNLVPDVALAIANSKPLSAKVQNEVFLAAGKVFDVMVNPTQKTAAGTYDNFAYPIFDRDLGLVANNHADAGMIAYLQMGTATPGNSGGVPAGMTVKAVADNYIVPLGATTFSGNVLANDSGISNASVTSGAAATGAQTIALPSGSVVLNPDGSFVMTLTATPTAADTFTYFGNGTSTLFAAVTFNGATKGGAPTAGNGSFSSNTQGYMKIGVPGVLTFASDPSNYVLTAKADPANPLPAGVTLNSDGSFTATGLAAASTFNYVAVNAQGTASTAGTVTLNFAKGSGLAVTVQDAQSQVALSDYKWVIEEDESYYPPVGTTNALTQPILATNFHKSYMPVIASGCTGPQSCELGQTILGVAQAALPSVMPSDVALDPTKHYYISVLPGDAGDAFVHGGGVPVATGGSVTLTPGRARISPGNVRVTTVTAAAGIDPGFQVGQSITLSGATNAAYNQTFFVTGVTSTGFTFTVYSDPKAPVLSTDNATYAGSNAFNPTKDCVFTTDGSGTCGHMMGGSPIAPGQLQAVVKVEPNPLQPAQLSVIVFEDNSPTNGDIDGAEENQPGLGGFQIILNDVAGATGITTGQMTYDMFNYPLTNALVGTIDSATGLDSCPAIPAELIQDPNNPRRRIVKPGTGISPKNSLVGVIITCPEFEANGRTVSPLAGHALIKNLFPDRLDVLAKIGAQREANGEVWIQTSTLEGTHANDAFAKIGEPAYFQEFGSPGYHSFIGFVNPAHIAARNAALKGTNSITGKITNLHMSRPSGETLYDSNSHVALAQTVCYVGLNAAGGTGDDIAFAQCDGDGNFTLTGVPPGAYQLEIWDEWQDQIIRSQDVVVPAGDNQVIAMNNLPAFSWFETIVTQTYLENKAEGNPGIAQVGVNIRFRDGQFAANSGTDITGNATFNELFPLFSWYVVESDTTRFKGTKVNVINDAGGAVDPDGKCCSAAAYGLSKDWPTGGVLNSTETDSLPTTLQVPGATYYPGTTVRNDPGSVVSEGFQAFIGQPQILEFGKTPYLPGETGGIIGHVVYNSTRPFDDPQITNQNLWEPLVPRVQINLYQEMTAADGSTVLTPVDHTTSSSWDDWASGTRADGSPNMSCPGQSTTDPFFNYTLGTGNQFKCYDGLHAFNQMQPAPYDGRFQFPTKACSVCKTNSDPNLPLILPAGKYVAEVVLPEGFEILKEEDKNILIGDAYIAPVTQQFGGLGNIFILPDQAEVNAYNPNNPNNPTNTLGRTSFGGFNVGEFQQNTPCVGRAHVVPDFMSIAPGSGQVAPFAGATKNLCDRREVTLGAESQAKVDFFTFTKTPKASKYTGIILDDLSSSFNPAKPDFGEKFAVPFVPISMRDFNGVEVARTYADQFGMYNGLLFSTWEVNPPNPTGYAPNMMITCMNDPGPIPDLANPGQFITDPNYNPQYSNFCYTKSFMPGTTDYLDTPVLPVAAFAAGYNPVDCAYPDTTPAIKTVNGNDPGNTFGPWVSGTGSTLTITALGTVNVPNNAYNGPSSGTGLGSQSTIQRTYSFGATPGTVALSSNGVITPLTVAAGDWTDTTIKASIPPGASTGELIITAANGKKSVDTVTVTVGGKTPTYVMPPVLNVNGAGLAHPIQDAIDAAVPGDLIMLGAGNYPELVIMWKPVRLQGVGAASVIINAAKYPTQKLEQWRPRINCFFGLDGQGNPAAASATCPADQLNAADPLTGQEITGGIVQLEPSVLGTEEGAGITVLAKNLRQQQCGSKVTGALSNFLCAPSRIDGLSVTGGDSGGGIYVNGWAHNLEIANNRVYGNAGIYNGGVRIGQPYLEGLTGRAPLNFDSNVKIHHNSITQNGTVEANTGLGGAGGGLAMCSGTDNYAVNYNFICGNFSEGDGGGIGHIGMSQNGVISNNQVIFNQSFAQAATTSGGGIAIEGEPGAAGQSLGTGNVTVDSNIVMGNSAQGGHGGGIRLQDVNGADVAALPGSPGRWWRVSVTNNMINDNVAGWSGGGISLMDTVNSVINFNTVVSNDSTATAGPLITVQNGTEQSKNQPAGVSAEPHGAVFQTAINAATCPVYAPNCKKFSDPTLENNILYQNRTFYFTVTSGTGANPGTPATAHLVPDLPASNSAGQCVAGAIYWDLGVVGQPEAAPALTLSPSYSVLTNDPSNSIYNVRNNQIANPLLVKQYCNGPRANPGIPAIAEGQPAPPFTFAVAATEDEGGNFVDLKYGPLSLSDSSIATSPANPPVAIGDYRVCGGSGNPSALCLTATPSPAIDVASNADGLAPNYDVFGSSRPQGAGYDEGAFEFPAQKGTVGVSPASLSFPLTLRRVFSAPQTITVSNVGPGPLAISTITIPAGANGTDFNQTNNCTGVTLQPAAVCTITVTFRPLQFGTLARTASMVINSNATNPVVTVPLSGTTNSGVIVAPSPRPFPNTNLGTTSTRTIMVTNNNPSTVTLTAPTITGTNASDFSLLAGGCGTTLTNGNSCNYNLQFKPSAAGARTAIFTVNDSLDPGGQAVTMTGTGTAPAAPVPVLTPNTHSFGTAARGVSTANAPTFGFTLSNTGNAQLTNIQSSFSGATEFSVALGLTTCGTNLNAGANCTITVRFRPPTVDTTGLKGATLTVTSSNGAAQTAALSGTVN